MRILLITLLLAAAVPAPAQNNAEAWLIPFAAAYQPQVDGFNAVFAKHGMPTAGSRQLGWGLELRTLTGGFLVGPLFFKTWNDAANSSYELRTDATGIFGEFGIKIAPFNFLAIVPQLGVGGLNQSFTLRAKGNSISLDSLLGVAAPQAVNLSPGMKVAGFGALELGFIANTRAGGFGLALRAGYMYSPFNLTWHIANGANVTDAPPTHLGGPLFSLGLVLMPSAQTTSD